MDYNKKRHLKLLKRLLYSKKLNKNFYQENPEDYAELRKYEIFIYDHIFWTRRKDFLLLMENFIDNIIDFENFETAFSLLFRKTTKEYNTFKIDLKQIDKFQPSTRSYRFASFIGSIFRQFEEVEDEYCTERDVKDFVTEVYLKFQNFEE